MIWKPEMRGWKLAFEIFIVNVLQYYLLPSVTPKIFYFLLYFSLCKLTPYLKILNKRNFDIK